MEDAESAESYQNSDSAYPDNGQPFLVSWFSPKKQTRMLRTHWSKLKFNCPMKRLDFLDPRNSSLRLSHKDFRYSTSHPCSRALFFLLLFLLPSIFSFSFCFLLTPSGKSIRMSNAWSEFFSTVTTRPRAPSWTLPALFRSISCSRWCKSPAWWVVADQLFALAVLIKLRSSCNFLDCRFDASRRHVCRILPTISSSSEEREGREDAAGWSLFS